MPPQQQQFDASNERQIQLALQALEQDATLSQRRAAAIYGVSQSTISKRRARQPLRVNTMPNSRNLTNTEEWVIVKHIVNLVKQGFPR